MRNDDNIRDMAHDIGKALVLAAITVVSIVFCAGIAVGAALRWGVS